MCTHKCDIKETEKEEKCCLCAFNADNENPSPRTSPNPDEFCDKCFNRYTQM